MRTSSTVRWAIGIVCTAALVITAGVSAHRSAGGADARAKLTIIAPAAAGGGWDLVAREAQQALRANKIVNNVQVVNVPGAAGTIGLAQLNEHRGDGSTVMITGTVMAGGIVRNDSPLRLDQMTPIGRLAQDFEVIAVPSSSRLHTMADLVAAWKANPQAFPVGGGSAGGIDHMVAAMMARTAQIKPSDVRYSAYAGGGELTINLLSTAPGTPEVGISGFNDFRDLLMDGRMRALMVVAPNRLSGIESTPTAAEAGFGAVDLVNWRGVIAPPGLSAEQQNELVAIFTEMAATEQWRDAVVRNGWQEVPLMGELFRPFLVEEQKQATTILEELGLA